MPQNIIEDKPTGKSFANKSPLIWILAAAVITLAVLIYVKDNQIVIDKKTNTPLFSPPAKSQQELEKEKKQKEDENRLKQKF